LLRIAPLFIILWIPTVRAQNNCMDCTERTNPQTNELEALCCMADDSGQCFGGYSVVEEDVGYGCQVSSPDPEGATWCDSSTMDEGCPDNGGGTGGGGGGGEDDCAVTGYCPPECMRCTQLY
jgi:hypothetical protein